MSQTNQIRSNVKAGEIGFSLVSYWIVAKFSSWQSFLTNVMDWHVYSNKKRIKNLIYDLKLQSENEKMLEKEM